ncbi:MAG TPA: hypothetical protein VKB57_16630 [Acidimicrobiales bacterium]|nr:hypothetical protein [Acidimicrobiales bacterium]
MAPGRRLATAAIVWLTLAGATAACGGSNESGPSAGCRSDGPTLALAHTTPGAIGSYGVLVAARSGATTRVTRNWVATDPSFSPDGRRLVVVRADGDYESSGPGSTALWLVGADGTGARALTNVSDDGVAPQDTRPAWSPDGRTVAFSRRLPNRLQVAGRGPAFRLMAVPADGGDARPLVDNDGAADFAPAWSPDGSRLAFIRERWVSGDRKSSVWTARADGTGAHQLADVPDGVSVRWRPDGDAVVVNAGGGVFLVDVDTGEPTLLAIDAALAAWAPDGEHLYWWAAGDTDGEWRLVEGRIVGEKLHADRNVGPVEHDISPTLGLAVSPCA